MNNVNPAAGAAASPIGPRPAKRRRWVALAAILLAGASIASVARAQTDAKPRGEPAPPLAPPPAGHWKLRVTYGDYRSGFSVAVLDYRVELDGDRYRLSTEGHAVGLVSLVYSGLLTQTSAGRVTPHGLVPDRYTERRGNRPERSASVDWSRRVVAFSGGGRAVPVDGMQDRLSVLFELGMMARAAPTRFAAGRTIAIQELTLSDVERTTYLVRGDEILSTEVGNLSALHLERTEPRGPDTTVVDVWLGYDRGMVPVRIRFTDPDGRVLDQVLTQ